MENFWHCRKAAITLKSSASQFLHDAEKETFSKALCTEWIQKFGPKKDKFVGRGK